MVFASPGISCSVHHVVDAADLFSHFPSVAHPGKLRSQRAVCYVNDARRADPIAAWERRSKQGELVAKLASDYSVSRETVRNVLNGKTYRETK